MHLVEVGPRDGFQALSRPLETRIKLEVIELLVKAGITEIQATSFVHPGKLPQMADAEELVRQLPERASVRYTALVLNRKGMDRAGESGLRHVEASVSLSDAHGRRNAGMPLAEARELAPRMIRLALQYGMSPHASLQCAFGCIFEGTVPVDRVLDMVRSCLDAGASHVVLADTTGLATPASVQRVLERIVPEVGPEALGLHFHDTRGLGLVNCFTALGFGISRFDTAIGGMGGCPFIPDAAGNIPTEDTAFLLHSLGKATGLDMDKLTACTQRLENLLGARLPAKIRPETLHCEATHFEAQHE
jgi:hydroxymethylglutaryl-CoA lyase